MTAPRLVSLKGIAAACIFSPFAGSRLGSRVLPFLGVVTTGSMFTRTVPKLSGGNLVSCAFPSNLEGVFPFPCPFRTVLRCLCEVLPNMGVSGVRGDSGGDDGPLAMAYNVPDAVCAVNVTPTGLVGRGSESSAINPLHFGASCASGGPWSLSSLGVMLVTV